MKQFMDHHPKLTYLNATKVQFSLVKKPLKQNEPVPITSVFKVKQLKTSMGCSTSRKYLSEQTLVNMICFIVVTIITTNSGAHRRLQLLYIHDWQSSTYKYDFNQVTRFYKCVFSVRVTMSIAKDWGHPMSTLSLALLCCRYMDQTIKKSWFDSRQGEQFLCSQNRPYWQCGLPSFLFNGKRKPFPHGKISRYVKLTTKAHLAPELRMTGYSRHMIVTVFDVFQLHVSAENCHPHVAHYWHVN